MSHLNWSSVLGIFLHLIFNGGVHGEFYSSADAMQDLAQVEREILNATRSYLEEQQKQLDFYRNFLEQIKEEHDWVVDQTNLDEYMGHPLHAFRLIKRLVQDWDELVFDPIMSNAPREELREFVDSVVSELGYPNESELQGAVKGIARLQNVYNLTTSDVADGLIDGVLYESELNWRECYEIGVILFDLGEYQRSLEWLQVAFVILRGNPGQEENENFYLSDIKEYAALANFELGNPKRSERLLSQILELESSSTSHLTRKYIDAKKPGKSSEVNNPTWYANYTRLCQGKKLPEGSNGRPLSCYLDGKINPYFVLAPLQVEPVHVDPDINVYHGMLSHQQMNSVFEEADKLVMYRSSVAGAGGQGTVADLRVSQQTWLNYTTPVMKSISRIIQFVSGFDMAAAEFMQVANYGVGGQYEPHPDYFEFNLPTQFHGDRISTSMFYLSDVEQGGYTVFTKLNVFLPPIKGAMVMWHNLHRSLDVDARTLHAGCPVLVGSKRIGNIWMHSGFQEFRRPCNITSDSYKSAAYRN
ncbi:prolyl 4-hydroxylase subunit alpha-1-like [Drosophila bipectinata]|uniref:prolyl 4-hydroxylase subunit alpha-1-like n=1 Tax=Drosophila bipectinata TaxID=42026 RepID=UPI001C895083|nr:prolyl 4-hydroxylase subunit alpha-1-like [Drosophila bipectinata]